MPCSPGVLPTLGVCFIGRELFEKGLGMLVPILPIVYQRIVILPGCDSLSLPVAHTAQSAFFRDSSQLNLPNIAIQSPNRRCLCSGGLQSAIVAINKSVTLKLRFSKYLLDWTPTDNGNALIYGRVRSVYVSREAPFLIRGRGERKQH